MRRKAKTRIKSFIALLAGMVLCLPLLNDMFHFYPEEKMNEWENRSITAKPAAVLSHLDPFPGDYEKFHDDHFPFRNVLLELFINYQYHLLGDSPFPTRVLTGGDHWLFEGERERKLYEGRPKPSEDTIELIINMLRHRTLEYKKKNVEFYITIAPLKHMIYPERLPLSVRKAREGTFSERLVRRLEKDTIIRYIDLYSPLIRSKTLGELYFRTDNHWNYLGAFLAYQQIIKVMQQDFPSLKHPSLSDYRISRRFGNRTGNLGRMIGLTGKTYDVEYTLRPAFTPSGKPGPLHGYPVPEGFAYPWNYERVSVSADTALPAIVVIRDSFFDFQIEYFSQSFRKGTYIFDAWAYGFNAPVVENESPDIVLLQIFEPHLTNLVAQAQPDKGKPGKGK